MTSEAPQHDASPKPPETSYAQNREDIVLARGFPERRGFYVDIGAYDPEVDSVTKLFYDRGWRGINVEPLTTFMDGFDVNRPRDINVRAAISDIDGEQELWVSPAIVPGHSTLDRSIAQAHESDGLSFAPRSVPTLRLDTLFDKYLPSGTTVDFLKIDVEGAEKLVLASWTPDRVRPRVVLVEALAPYVLGSTHHEWEPLLLSAGYRMVLFDGLNRFYVRDDEPELAERIAVPANILDPFAPVHLLRLSEEAEAMRVETHHWKSLAASLGERTSWLEHRLAAYGKDFASADDRESNGG